jgi:hypothetical protein
MSVTSVSQQLAGGATAAAAPVSSWKRIDRNFTHAQELALATEIADGKITIELQNKNKVKTVSIPSSTPTSQRLPSSVRRPPTRKTKIQPPPTATHFRDSPARIRLKLKPHRSVLCLVVVCTSWLLTLPHRYAEEEQIWQGCVAETA